MDQPPPPPPPPHGQYPKSSSSGLPPGNYDIFIIPPHSSGSGFLYLPSLKSNVNSFAAGFASALILVVVGSALAPFARIWWTHVNRSGGVGISILILAVAVGAWALGRIQIDRETKSRRNRNGSNGPSGANESFNNNGSYSGGQSSYSYSNSNVPPSSAGSTQGGGTSSGNNNRGPNQSQWSRSPDDADTTKENSEYADKSARDRTRENSKKREQEKKEQERTDYEKREREKKEQERRDQERREVEQERKERERKDQERRERERQRKEQERKEQERKEREKEEIKKREEARKRKEELEKRLKELREKDARERAAREKKLQDEAEREARAKIQKEQEEKEAAQKAEEALAAKKRELEKRLREEFEAKRNEERAAAVAAALAEKKKKEEEDRLRRRREYEERLKKKKAEEEAIKILEEAKRKFEEATKRLEEEELKKKREEEDKKKREEEIRKKREEEFKKRLEEMKKKREEEAKRKQEEEAKRKQEEEAKKKLTDAIQPRKSTMYAFTAGERTNPWPNGRPVSPNKESATSSAAQPTPSKVTNQPSPTIGAFKNSKTSNTPHHASKEAQRKNSVSSLNSRSSHVPTKSTTKTNLPSMSKNDIYRTKDQNKIVIKAVYSFNNAFLKTPVTQLVSGVGSVTDGLILRMTTEGLFIDDEIRNVPQREWDVKAWTMKLVELWCPSCQDSATTSASMRPSASPSDMKSKRQTMRRLWGLDKDKTASSEEIDALLFEMLSRCHNTCHVRAAAMARNMSPASSTYSVSSFGDSAYGGSVMGRQMTEKERQSLIGLHILRASIRDQEGKKYVFIVGQEESWKIVLGLQRLRKGTQARALNICGMNSNEAKNTLDYLGWA
ncbi:hypothetical protein HI914_05413 [Erysiphe necator]|nr:hypothetical protein HI914_05413 [Erysiphe necator]